MIDETPYIIVDNQKIAPIGRLPRSDSATADRKESKAQAFGVIDRVTISREAREKARHQQPQREPGIPAPGDPSNKPPATTRALLTYSLRQPR